jgi:WD40 repeat protein
MNIIRNSHRRFTFLAGLFALLIVLPFGARAADSSEKTAGRIKPEIFVQLGHTSSINTVEFSQDGRYVLSGSDDDTIKLWEAQNGKLIRTFKDGENVRFVAFLSGDSFFSLNDKGNICIWDIQSGRRVREFALGESSSNLLHDDVITYDGAVLRVILGLRLYHADIGRRRVTQTVERPKNGEVRDYLGFGFGFRNAVSTDGRLMLSTVRENANESMMKSNFKKIMLWDIASGRILATLTGHEDLIDVVALSPGNHYALSGSRDKTVRIWDLKRGQTQAVFTGHQKAVEALAFSSDLKYVLSGSRDHTMKLWDVDAQKEILTFAHDCPVKLVRFTPDGRHALSGDDNGAIRFWDISSGKEVSALKSHVSSAYAVAASSDGRYLLTGSFDGEIRLWDANRGRLLKTIDAHRGGMTTVGFTPDHRYIFSAGYDRTVKLWNTADGKLYRTFAGHAGEVSKASVSPDGLHLLSSSWKNQMIDVRLWNIASGAQMKVFSFPGFIRSLGFSSDGKRLLIAHSQKTTGDAIKILALDGRESKSYTDVGLASYAANGRHVLARDWRDASGPERKLFEPGAAPPKAVFHRDEYSRRNLLDIESGKVLGRFGQSGAVLSIAVSDDPNLLLIKNRNEADIRLWNVRDGREIRRYPAKFGLFAEGGKKIIAPAVKTLQSFETASPSPPVLFRGSAAGGIASMALSARGGYAVTGDTSGQIQFWDIANRTLLKTITADERNIIASVAFSPDNRLAASLTFPETINIWNLEDGRNISKFKTDTFVYMDYEEMKAGNFDAYGNGMLAFSPDSRHLVFGSKAWDALTGRKVMDFQTPFGPGPYVAFSPDGTQLLSNNMTWDAATGRRLVKMESINGAVLSVYSADGKTIYSADEQGYFFMTDAATGKLMRRFGDYLYSAFFDISGDVKMLAAADLTYPELSLWHPASGKKSAAIAVDRPLSSVSIAADGRTATAKSGVAAAQYDLRSGKETAQYIGFADGEWIVITPEGYYSASPGGERYLSVRVNDQVYGIENYREAFFRPDLVQMSLSGGSLQDFRKLADVGLPPAVKIVDTPSEVRSDEVTVNLQLADQGGGIGDIRLYLNGTAVVMDSRAVSVRPKTGAAMEKQYALKLVNGKNVISAAAFNSDNSMQSNEAVLEVTAAFAQASKPSLSALVIGVNEFKNPKLKLQYPAADAKLFADTLKAASGELFDRVTIKTLMTTQETTKEAILRDLKTFQSLRPDDLFVFYIASHGTVDEGEYFLITSNVGSLRTEKLKTDAISQHQLKEAIANIPATKKLIIIDTCNAGALGEAIQAAMLTRGMSEDTALKILSRAVGSTILSASTSLQEALEGYQGHGLFTYVLAEGLKGKADKGKTGFIKTTELADYVDNEVPLLAEKVFKRAQYPTISISGQAFPIGKVKE